MAGPAGIVTPVTFLPIVGRELRAASRRSGTYWVRLVVAAQATVAGVAAWVLAKLDGHVKFGTALFWGLAGVALVHCVLAGRRSTADCLSVEKRDGTMGLLFLTDLKGYDVVIGKLVATSLGGFYGLLAVFPILAVPLLVGGMTSGEFWRMMATLLVTFGFSLGIGIFCSAISREYREAIGRNFLILTTLTVILPMIGASIEFSFPAFNPAPLCAACPFVSFALCADDLYKRNHETFWSLLVVMHGLMWLLIVRACRILPKAWQDEPAVKGGRSGWWKAFKRALNYGGAFGRTAFRKYALDRNAYFWLTARERLKPAHVWAFLATAVVWWLCGWAGLGSTWLDESSCVVMALLLIVTLKFWVTVEAGQRLAADREIGSMELLLCTALTADDYVQGQIVALRRQFVRPLIAAAMASFGMMAIALAQRSNSGWFPWVAGIVLLPADIAALSLDGMWTSLTCKTHTRATLTTVMRIMVLPWVGVGLVEVVLAGLRLMEYIDPDTSTTNLLVGAWFLFGVGVDVVFGLRAWQKLHSEFREAAMQRYGARAMRIEKAKKSRRTAVRWRPALAGAAALAACAFAVYEHGKPKAPPVTTAALQGGSGPVKTFSGWNHGVFFVLPDGSLWRWGQPEGPAFPRAAAPEQIGTNRDWAKITVLNGPRVYALRTNGTIWEWGQLPNGRFTNEPVQRNLETDWTDIAVTDRNRVALKRDGTMWAWAPSWGAVTFSRGLRFPQQVGRESNWVKIVSARSGIFGLQRNGTLWYWGETAAGQMPGPAQMCQETTWTNLSEDCSATLADGRRFDLDETPAGPTPNAATNAGAVFRPDVGPAMVDGRRLDWFWRWRPALGPPMGEGPALALGADSVVLMWGIDPGVQFKLSFAERVRMATQRQHIPPMGAMTRTPRTVLKLARASQ